VRCSKVSWTTLTAWMLLGLPDEGERSLSGHGALAQDARLGAGEIDDRGGKTCELSPVDDRAAAGLDLDGNVRETARIAPAVEIRTGCREGSDPAEHLGCRRRKRCH